MASVFGRKEAQFPSIHFYALLAPSVSFISSNLISISQGNSNPMPACRKYSGS